MVVHIVIKLQTMNKIRKWIKNQTEFYLAFFAGMVWAIFWLMSLYLGTESYPVGYFQKIAFGILAMSIIQGVAFFALKKGNPYYADLLDPNTQGGINDLTTWEKVKIGLFYLVFFGWGAMYLASQY